MRRLVAAVAAVALLVAGSAAVAMAAPALDDQAPQPGWFCPGWSSSFGNYNPATNPTIQRLAGKLGVGADALVSELKSGKSVADVAKEKGVDEQVLVDTLIAPQKDMMAIRVKYGYLTQDQADQAINSLTAAVKSQLETKGYFTGGAGYGPGNGYGPGWGMMGGGYGPGWGMMGGFGGMMGRFFSGQNRSN